MTKSDTQRFDYDDFSFIVDTYVDESEMFITHYDVEVVEHFSNFIKNRRFTMKDLHLDKLSDNITKKIEICKILEAFSDEYESNTYYDVNMCVPGSWYESVADAIIKKCC